MPALFKEIGVIPWTYNGTVWVRREFTVPQNLVGKRFVLHLGRIYDWDTVWINGRQIGATEDRSWYGIYRSYWVYDETLLRAGSNTIAMRILNRGNSCGVAPPWDGDMRLDFFGAARLPLGGEWRLSPGIELSKAASPLPIGNRGDDQPATLYNTLVAPLTPMTIKGAIWYQGEGNSGRSEEYHALLPALIGDWRSVFAQGDFPFLIVQLPNWANHPKRPETSPWAEIREAQSHAARTLPNCGLTVTIDIGDSKAIHPTNKQPVGHRLALAAKAIAYGQQTEWSGPWYKGMTVEDRSIRLTFDHLGGGLVASDGAPLTGFAIAGDDQVFTWAEARIDGDTVVVSSPLVPKPVAVRYAWATNPACNLANKAGLPGVPFSTCERSCVNRASIDIPIKGNK
jgi:sialate O-acetylesterase